MRLPEVSTHRAHGIQHTRPILARDAHLSAANEPGVTSCVRCTVCGGKAQPKDNGLCDACRGLAATFARAAEVCEAEQQAARMRQVGEW